jgi:5-methylcytosine-specific restriction endonuclease McrA
LREDEILEEGEGRCVMDTRTLLLNSWMMPHAVLNWHEAIILVYQGKVDILEEYEETVSSPSITYFVPAVLRLRKTVSSVKRGLRFSRVNVFSRDGYRCQYCGEKKTMKELNYDHVIPRRQGGKTTWENIVTSCYPCNDRKGGRTPEQARMQLLRKPAKPHALPLHAVYLDTREIPEAWEPYLNLGASQRIGEGIYVVGSSAA